MRHGAIGLPAFQNSELECSTLGLRILIPPLLHVKHISSQFQWPGKAQLLSDLPKYTTSYPGKRSMQYKQKDDENLVQLFSDIIKLTESSDEFLHITKGSKNKTAKQTQERDDYTSVHTSKQEKQTHHNKVSFIDLLSISPYLHFKRLRLPC